MPAPKTCIIARCDAVVIARIGVLVVSDDLIRASLLRAGKAYGAAGHLYGGWVYAHRIDALRRIQPFPVRRDGHKVQAVRL